MFTEDIGWLTFSWDVGKVYEAGSDGLADKVV